MVDTVVDTVVVAMAAVDTVVAATVEVEWVPSIVVDVVDMMITMMIMVVDTEVLTTRVSIPPEMAVRCNSIRNMVHAISTMVDMVVVVVDTVVRLVEVDVVDMAVIRKRNHPGKKK